MTDRACGNSCGIAGCGGMQRYAVVAGMKEGEGVLDHGCCVDDNC